MKEVRSWVLVTFLMTGCYSPINEIIEPHVEAGGTIEAYMDSGAPVMTKGLADGKVDPMTVEGTSAELVFGLVVGDDETGQPAKPLLLAGTAVSLPVSADSSTKLSVHLGGRSCATTFGLVHVRPDGKGHLSGDFSGSATGCAIGGTLTDIPIDPPK